MEESLRNTYASALRRCGETGALQDGKSIHKKITLTRALERDVFLLNLVVQMYGKCSSVEDARTTFNRMPNKNIFTWNLMIGAYAQNGHHKEAIALFGEMNCRLTSVTFVGVLNACAGLGELSHVVAVHARIEPDLIERELVLGTALVNAYAKCGSLHLAGACARVRVRVCETCVPGEVFERMKNKDGICYNAMMSAAAQHGEFTCALTQFQKMQLEGIRATTATVVSFAACCRDSKIAKSIHKQVFDMGLDVDINTMNSLVTMYGNCGSSSDAWEVFNSMRKRDVITWNAMISAHVQCGEYRDAWHLSRKMDLEGVKFEVVTFLTVLRACEAVSDGVDVHSRLKAAGYDNSRVVGTSLLSMYGRCGDLELATKVFSGLPNREQTSYNAMITQYVQYGKHTEAFGLYEEMLSIGVEPNNVTFISLLEVCDRVEDGRRLHERVRCLGLETDDVLGTLLVNMYGSCGSVEDARCVFDRVRGTQVKLWNAMLGAYNECGCYSDAVRLSVGMDHLGMKLDEVSFINLLAACTGLEDSKLGTRIHKRVAHAGCEHDVVTATSLVNMYFKCGLPERGMKVFHGMQRKDAITWNAVVGGYAQLGHLDDSMAYVLKMDIEGMEPDESVFAAMAACCRCLSEARKIHKFVGEAGMEVGVAVVHMYAKCGCVEEARKVFVGMCSSDLESWNSIIQAYAQNGHVHEMSKLFMEMINYGIDPDRVSFSCVLNGISHHGAFSSAKEVFWLMMESDIEPDIEHYGCLISLLGRVGWLKQAEELLNVMPFEPDATIWTTLLSASALHSHVGLAEQSAEYVTQLDPQNSAPYVLLSHAIRRKRCSNLSGC